MTNAVSVECAIESNEQHNPFKPALLNLRALPIKTYCELFDDTVESIKKRVQRGYWVHGQHVVKPDGVKNLWVNLEAVEEWARKNCQGASSFGVRRSG